MADDDQQSSAPVGRAGTFTGLVAGSRRGGRKQEPQYSPQGTDLSGVEYEGGGRQGGAVELAQMNEPHGPSNGASTDHAANKGEFFTGHP